MFSFTNEIFEKAIEAYESGVTLGEALEFHGMFRTGRNLGYVVVPSDVFRYIAEKVYSQEPENLLKNWYESGLWNGSYLSIKFQTKDPVTVARSYMKACLWNLDEFLIDESKDKLEVRCFSPSLSEECVLMLGKFLEGMFSSFGYSIGKSTHLRGIVTMELLQNGAKDPHTDY